MVLTKEYFDPSSDVGFSGVEAIFQYFKKRVSREKIKKLLEKYESYTLLREPRRPKKFNPVYTYHPRKTLCGDLFYFDKQSRFNNGFGYILSVIDSFSRKSWCIPIKRKTAECTLDAFKKLHQIHIGEFDVFMCDRGLEFTNSLFKTYLKDHDIQLWHPYRLGKVAIVERFQKTIEVKIGKYLIENKTKNFVKVLDQLVDGYNNSFHRSLQCTPNEVEASLKKQTFVRGLNEEKFKKVKKQKPRFKIGQKVRISLPKTKFDRAYKKRFTDEVYSVRSIDNRFPIPMYEISTLDGTQLVNVKFLHSELSPVNLNE